MPGRGSRQRPTPSPAESARPGGLFAAWHLERAGRRVLLLDASGPANALIVGAGSGHGFKHGRAVGRYAADLLTGRRGKPEPRLALSTKGDVQRREVH